MYGAVLRVSAGWAGSMLLSAVVATFSAVILPLFSVEGLIYESLDGIATWLPVIATIAALLVLIATGLAERRAV